MLVVEFVFGTHCILTQGQVKPELPDSPQLLHRDTTFSIGMPSYAKSTIARLPFGRYIPMLRSDSIFLSFGWIVRPNYVMLSFLFWRVSFVVLEGKKCQHDDSLGT